MTWIFGDLEPWKAGVILIDPPWSFQPYSTNKTSPKSARHHYSLMSFADLKSLPVGDLAAENCEMVMWATQAQVPEALQLVKAYGFHFKSMGTWAKRSRTWTPGCEEPKWAIGTGYVRRCRAEFFIVATRGNPKRASRSVTNFIEAANREHSRKPDQMYVDLERLFPTAIKYELFARESRAGWRSWGRERNRFRTWNVRSDG